MSPPQKPKVKSPDRRTSLPSNVTEQDKKMIMKLIGEVLIKNKILEKNTNKKQRSPDLLSSPLKAMVSNKASSPSPPNLILGSVISGQLNPSDPQTERKFFGNSKQISLADSGFFRRSPDEQQLETHRRSSTYKSSAEKEGTFLPRDKFDSPKRDSARFVPIDRTSLRKRTGALLKLRLTSDKDLQLPVDLE